jgi:hypothetical protein
VSRCFEQSKSSGRSVLLHGLQEGARVEDQAAAKDFRNGAHVGDRFEGVRIQQDEVRELAGLDRPEQVGLPDRSRVVERRTAERLGRRRPDSTSSSSSWSIEKPGVTKGSGASVPTSSGTPAL